MGKRYTAILNYLGVEHIGIDEGDDFYPPRQTYDKAIICTPTESHYRNCYDMAILDKDFLCEKPVSKDLDEVSGLVKYCKHKKVTGSMVCNWQWALGFDKLNPNSNTIFYDNYNTGKDGIGWDCIQLIYLDKKFPAIKNQSPYFSASINSISSNLKMIEHSYIFMIDKWLKGSKDIWTMEDAYKATEKVIEYNKMKGIE